MGSPTSSMCPAEFSISVEAADEGLKYAAERGTTTKLMKR